MWTFVKVTNRVPTPLSSQLIKIAIALAMDTAAIGTPNISKVSNPECPESELLSRLTVAGTGISRIAILTPIEVRRPQNAGATLSTA